MTTNKAGTREEWLKAHSNCSTQKIGGSVSEALARPPPRDFDSEGKSCVFSVFLPPISIRRLVSKSPRLARHPYRGGLAVTLRYPIER
jgi:hypothetical protein